MSGVVHCIGFSRVGLRFSRTEEQKYFMMFRIKLPV